MSDEPRRLTHQQLLQARASDSNIQPVRYFSAGLPPDRVADYFTHDSALALLGLRKEGEKIVRN